MHNTEYTSIFIPKNITVVVKHNKAYIADTDNEKTMSTAKLWADNNGYCMREEATPPQILQYINDGFRLKILSAAGNSSQSGKLSFWMCEITAPDNKTFNVGVNSELMCELICSSCFINGKCQEDLKFGVRNNQWGFFSESMPAYKEYIKSEKLRNEMNNNSTTKYNPGDIVRTLSESKLYVGEMYKYFDVKCRGGIYYPWEDNGISETEIIVYKTPKKFYTFASSYRPDEYEIYPETSMLKKKPKRLLTGARFDENAVKSKFYSALQSNYNEYLENTVRWRPFALLSDLMYGDDPNSSEARTDMIRNRVSDCIKKLVTSGQVRGLAALSQVTYIIED